MGRLGQDAVVIGAGMGGLAAAAALAPHFSRVTVLDKDRPGEGLRMGVGQGGHTHFLLRAGADALETLCPGLCDRFEAAGAPRLQTGLDLTAFDFAGALPQHDAGFFIHLLTRPRYEAILREAVLAAGNVTLRGDVAVERAVVSDGRCAGVALSDGEVIPADVVVDAAGMNGPITARLAADGEAQFDTEAVKINVSYTSALFDRPAAWRGEGRAYYVLPGAPNPAFALLAPVEDDRWMVSLGMRGKDAVPRDLDGFRAFAKALPAGDIYERLKDATPVGEIRTFRKIFATRRRFGAAAKWPQGLIPIGDAMTSFNPTFGQGMSVAAMQSAALAKVLSGRDTLEGLCADYFPPAEAIAAQAWAMAITTDYTYPETEGDRPADFEQSVGAMKVLRALAARDPEVLAARWRVGHMLESGALFRQSPYAEKIDAFVAAMKARQPA